MCLYLLPLFLAIFGSTNSTSGSTVHEMRTTALSINKAHPSNKQNHTDFEEKDTFLERIVKNGIFVDKTLLISKLAFPNETQTYLITFPRRWGKTYNLQMIKQFLEIPKNISTRPINETENRQLFQFGKVFRNDECIIDLENPLLISKHPDFFKHQGQYPVIHLHFLTVGASSHNDFMHRFYTAVLMAFEEHASSLAEFSNQLTQEKTDFQNDILTYNTFIDRIKQPRNTLSEMDLQKSIFVLSHCLFLFHKKKVFVLIDEYDAPITDIMTNKHYRHKNITLEFYRGFMTRTFQNNQFLKHGILTGIFQLSESILSISEFIREHGIIGTPLQIFYGLIEQEVLDILNHIGEQQQMQNIKKWYEGYRNINNSIVTYNVWSIFTYIKERKFAGYWIRTGTATKWIFKQLLNISISEDLFTTILTAETYYIVMNDFKFTAEDFDILLVHQNKHLMPSEETLACQNLIKFLLSTGYLTITDSSIFKKTDDELKIRIGVTIPTTEVTEEFGEILKDYFTHKFLLEDEEAYVNQSNDIVKNLCSFAISDAETCDILTKSIESYLHNLLSNNTLQNMSSNQTSEKVEKIFHSMLNSVMTLPGNRRTLRKFATESHNFTTMNNSCSRSNYFFVHKNHGIIMDFKFHDSKYSESGYTEGATKRMMDSAFIFQHEKKVKKIKLICVNTFFNKTIQIIGKKIDTQKTDNRKKKKTT